MAQLDDKIWHSSLCLSSTGNFRQNPRRSSPPSGAAPLPFAWILPRLLFCLSWVRIRGTAKMNRAQWQPERTEQGNHHRAAIVDHRLRRAG